MCVLISVPKDFVIIQQAKEREERQRLRAQRRAELEAKRKEREGERAKLRAERAAKKSKVIQSQ